LRLRNFCAFKDSGINRVSVGVQAFVESDLKRLGREHNSLDAIRAIEIAKECF
jgi:oxygen-independent coproporphyrinogen-3 oxidase